MRNLIKRKRQYSIGAILLFALAGLWVIAGCPSPLEINQTAPSTTLNPVAAVSTTLLSATTVPGVTTTTLPIITTTTLRISSGTKHNLRNIFFFHHSIGSNLVINGRVREVINNYNRDNGTNFVFWDHAYAWNDAEPYWGLRDTAGNLTHSDYGPMTSYNSPGGYADIWTTDNETRTRFMSHEVIAMKTCYLFPSDADLMSFKSSYLQMRDYFDAHPEKLFIIITHSPVHRLDTDNNAAVAKNARDLATWLKSSASGGFLAGSHPNIVCFDFFDLLANPDNGSPEANMLKYEYEMTHAAADSHPNSDADAYIGPIFARFLIDSSLNY